jgi:superoxide dismutase, Cu-Zn family
MRLSFDHVQRKELTMKTTVRMAYYACFALLSAAGSLACGSDDEAEDTGEMLASSQNEAVRLYADPYAPGDRAGTPNPIGNTARAAATAFDVDGKLRIELTVTGFPASRPFGSHLHRLPCEDTMKAGGHYQNMPFPTGGMATDPTYANATNEAWLDFTTNAAGEGERELTVDWIPRSGEARAIIFHDMLSGVGGVSGAKLACLPIVGF